MPADVSASSSTVVETVRLTSSERRASRSRSHEMSNVRSKHQNQRTLEPPLEQTESSSSPRLHATSSPAPPRTTTSTSSTTHSNANGNDSEGGSAHSTSRRTHVDLGTPQHQHQHANSPPRAWPQDEISLPSLRDHDSLTGAAGWMSDDMNNFFSSDDHFLSNLANDAQTPSPSHLRSSVNRSRQQPPAPGPQRQGRRTDDLAHSPGRASVTDPRSNTTAGNSNTNISQSNIQNSTSATTSFNSARSFLTNESSNASFHDVSTTQTSLASDEDMPAVTRRQAAAQNDDDDLELLDSSPVPCSTKRRRSSTRAIPDKTIKRVKVDDDNPFADIEETNKGNQDDDLCMVDLTEPKDPAKEPSETPEEPPPRNPNVNRISGFQCAICMDDVTSLTVTHCGHMYCAQCLHSSLHVETTKGKCPMCRAKLDMKPREEYNTRTKGFYHLELKLMTRTKKGKRKAGEAS